MYSKLIFTALLFSFCSVYGIEGTTKITSNFSLAFHQDNPKKLVGKWIMDGDEETYIELKSDGTVVEKSIGEPLERFWSVKDDKLCLKATLENGGTEMCLDFVLKEDALTLVMDDMKLPYTRFKG
ncbi:hypothetical protein M0D21_14170 [Aquimarina sp. D1M17]|uniref:hypothetical protein n=1 Tax=Aquimarina acroporae TaxID=2937283 RepID=UPI0020BF1CC1|nr:hypothetical protein [Aquimarina acroporae]MCK8522727.1 hypothetical protein [Aquimarina acroporae]